MKYISKGYVVEGSTEHIMRVSHFGREFRLTGVKAALWLNGHGRFDAIDETNNIYRRELEHLRRIGLVEPVEANAAGEYRADAVHHSPDGERASVAEPGREVHACLAARRRAAPHDGRAGVPL